MFPAPGRLPFTVKTNGDTGATLAFYGTDDIPWDLTNATSYTCQVRRVDGGNEVLGDGTVTVVSASEGRIAVNFHGPSFAYLVSGSQGFMASYDLRVAIDGKLFVLLEGPLYIRPGVSGI